MTQLKFITAENVRRLTEDLIAKKMPVIAPIQGAKNVFYGRIESWSPQVLKGDLPRRSLKEVFFPPTEPLLHWIQKMGDVELKEVPTEFPPQVILGALPCDVAALELVDKVMGWDYKDELWFGRRQATTILSLACSGGDKACFCEKVGLSPESRRGSDILLEPQGNGYLAHIETEKGRIFVETHATYFSEGQEAAANDASVETGTLNGVASWLGNHFEDPFWKEIALRCHGCGVCAMVCPTCHCFDIVDEPDGANSGTRRRNWDTCQTGKFTLHASGHNPRADQNSRFRQRLMHKFRIYPKRFGETLCTGCGRCVRACPAGMDLPEMLDAVSAKGAAL